MTDSRHAQAALSLQLSRNLQTIIERQRGVVVRRNDQAAKQGEATGHIQLPGAGEMTADVAFPIVFYERPVFTYGFELGAGSYLVQGDFPIGTATVASWATRDLNGTATYVGAKLAIVLIGLTGAGVCHFTFKGKSLMNPVGS